MRVLVCGSRQWHDRGHLFAVLDAFHANTDPIEVVIEGCAPGADRMAELWAAERRAGIAHYPARWATCGKTAGFIRNRRMLRNGNPDAVIAFHLDGSPGTADMIALSEEAGIPVYVVRGETDMAAPPRRGSPMGRTTP